VYNLKGQLVRSLIGDEYLEKGRHEVVWDGKDNSSKLVGTGMYFYKLEAKDTSTTKKMLLLK
jgi:flagellar hook assembly protein FlgD